ncbi:MAG: response regulator [Pseudomonadales bacterium]
MSTIHIIEPDSAILGGLFELLQSLQWPVRGYINPQHFLAAYYDYSNGFLVVDFDAREMADFKFFLQLQEHNISLPTVLISSRVDQAFKTRAFDAGAIDVIGKPLVNDLLLARIRQCVPEVTQSVLHALQ